MPDLFETSFLDRSQIVDIPDFTFRVKKDGKFSDIGHPGLSYKALIDQKEASEESLLRATSENDSQLTASEAISRYQSNDSIEGSDLTDAYIVARVRSNN